MPNDILRINRLPYRPFDQILSYLVPTWEMLNLTHLAMGVYHRSINQVVIDFPSLHNARVLRQICMYFHRHVDRLLYSQNAWIIERPSHLIKYLSMFRPRAMPQFQTILLDADCAEDEEFFFDRHERRTLVIALLQTITSTWFPKLQNLSIRVPLEMDDLRNDADVVEQFERILTEHPTVENISARRELAVLVCDVEFNDYLHHELSLELMNMRGNNVVPDPDETEEETDEESDEDDVDKRDRDEHTESSDSSSEEDDEAYAEGLRRGQRTLEAFEEVNEEHAETMIMIAGLLEEDFDINEMMDTINEVFEEASDRAIEEVFDINDWVNTTYFEN